MLFKFLVLIFALPRLLCDDVFPPGMRWTNSLDTPDKVRLFTSSNLDFGRDVVYLKGEADEEHVYMGKGDFKLMHCLREFNNSRLAHQIILVFEDFDTYAKALKDVLVIFKYDWFWVHFKIQQGPKSVAIPVNLSQFKDVIPTMRKLRNQISFGFTKSPNIANIGGYAGPELAALAAKTDEWYTALEYDRQFMVEVSMYLVIMTRDRMRFLKPFISRSMSMNLEADKDIDQIIIKNKGILTVLAKAFGPERIYMNIPEEVRKAIDPDKWKVSKPSSTATRHVLFSYLMTFVFIILNA